MQLQLGIKIIAENIQNLPHSPGIYQMLDEKHRVLYVGKAKDLKKRVSYYTKATRLPHRLQCMIAETKQMAFVQTHTELEALLLENNLIARLQPKYNVVIYDEKRAIFLVLSKNHEFPRLFKYRGEKSKNGKHFGPFISSSAVNNTISTLQKAFLLRVCSDSFFKNRSRPCLQYQMKRCCAPCVGKISTVDYDILVRQALNFLEGKTAPIRKHLVNAMQAMSDKQEYELAAFYRDRIKALGYLLSHQKINTNADNVNNTDIIAIVEAYSDHCIQLFQFNDGKQIGHSTHFFENNHNSSSSEVLSVFLGQYYSKQVPPKEIVLNTPCDNLELLKAALSEIAGHKINIIIPTKGKKLELVKYAQENATGALMRHHNTLINNKDMMRKIAEIFYLPTIPQRIEIYDNSHTGGTNAYGVMVVATPSGFIKSSYKRFVFSEHEAKGGDDYNMMYNMMLRRFNNIYNSNNNLPDLIIVDGGKGQLNAALRALQQLNLAEKLSIIAMAKGKNRNKGPETFWTKQSYPIILDKNSEILYYLERLRDEAHRFCIETHRAKNIKQVRQSILDGIASIGPKRSKALLTYFGSIDGIIDASIKDLQKVENINEALAQKIYSYFHCQ